MWKIAAIEEWLPKSTPLPSHFLRVFAPFGGAYSPRLSCIKVKMPICRSRANKMNPLSTELSVSVIVPVYNGGGKFRQCLASVKASHLSPREIIVIADGDTDGSWQLAKDFGA